MDNHTIDKVYVAENSNVDSFLASCGQYTLPTAHDSLHHAKSHDALLTLAPATT